jgi:ketosteroid isomerase-like protein
MRVFLAVVSLLLSFSAALAGPTEDALQVIDTWAKAFTASDVDGIVKLYAPDALFVGTGSKTVVTKPEGIRKYFEAALLTNRPRGATLESYEAMPLSDTAVVVAGLGHGDRGERRQSDQRGRAGDICGCQARRGLADRAFSSFGNAAMKQTADDGFRNLEPEPQHAVAKRSAPSDLLPGTRSALIR